VRLKLERREPMLAASTLAFTDAVVGGSESTEEQAARCLVQPRHGTELLFHDSESHALTQRLCSMRG
jgi:hypothetical protein